MYKKNDAHVTGRLLTIAGGFVVLGLVLFADIPHLVAIALSAVAMVVLLYELRKGL
jgi:hypothetical protein